MFEDDPAECMKQCESLLKEPKLDIAVRVGDVYALMVAHFAGRGHYEQVDYLVSCQFVINLLVVMTL